MVLLLLACASQIDISHEHVISWNSLRAAQTLLVEVSELCPKRFFQNDNFCTMPVALAAACEELL
jgi:hypothetical protein